MELKKINLKLAPKKLSQLKIKTKELSQDSASKKTEKNSKKINKVNKLKSVKKNDAIKKLLKIKSSNNKNLSLNKIKSKQEAVLTPKRKKESLVEVQERAIKVVNELKRLYPDAHCALNHKNAFELLVATILSAQCTDERVNKVTPALFNKYPDPFKMAEASLEDIEQLVRSTGFFKNKAKNIKACAQEIVLKHNGNVPSNMEDLHRLAGVGRKTANVVLGTIFGVPSMVVDTHVTRLSNRLGFVKGVDAVKLEYQLQKIIPKEDWTMYSHYIIYHGRQVCKARGQDCGACTLNNLCPKKPY